MIAGYDDRRFTIACCRFESLIDSQADRWQLKVKKALKTRKRGQGARCPDRIITKSGYVFVKFFGSNASALQYSLNLTSNKLTVKPTRPSHES
jgi:lauroyl/myristoyl acyltransferase